jgi:hypothetical protein
MTLQKETTNAANDLTAQTATADNKIKTDANKATAENNALTTGVNAANTQSTDARTVTDANKSQTAADTQKQGALIGAIGAIGSSYARSDARLKSNVKPVSDRDLRNLAKHVRAVTYDKDPGYRDGANHAGELAQELERSALGRKIVSKDSNGLRSVDYAGLAGMMAAAAASSIRRREGRSNA